MQLAVAKRTNTKLETQNAKLSALYASEQSWFKQAEATIAAQASGGTAAIIAGGPDAMWNAVVAIWGMFPFSRSTRTAATPSRVRRLAERGPTRASCCA
jgi:hypothetical protein